MLIKYFFNHNADAVAGAKKNT